MMNLVGMGIFARVAEAKGFSAAARRLGISKSVVSKEVAKLERSLGARLLNRTTRQLSLTEVGAAFYEHCARIVQEAEEATLLVDRLHAKPRGVLKCTAPVAFATLHIAAALPEFLARCPEVQVDLTVGDRFFDLAEEGFDLAIRIARELPPNMVARKLAPINRVVCGTPDYFEKHGVPVVPQDLERHNCLVYTHANPDSLWRFRSAEGEIAVQVRGNLRLNDDEVIWRAVLGGLGISMLPTFHGWQRSSVGPPSGGSHRVHAGRAQPLRALPPQPPSVCESARLHRFPARALRAAAVLGSRLEHHWLELDCRRGRRAKP
jgi:DNA-binding transcriptional LysR family regulator